VFVLLDYVAKLDLRVMQRIYILGSIGALLNCWER